MNKTILTTALENLALLVLVAMPLFFALLWVRALVAGVEGATDLGGVAEMGVFSYLAIVVPVLVGGLIHHVIWFVLPMAWPGARRRLVALFLAAVYPNSTICAILGRR